MVDIVPPLVTKNVMAGMINANDYSHGRFVQSPQ